MMSVGVPGLGFHVNRRHRVAGARYAFVYGDFRRLHRMGLIACYYRAAEWEHTEVMRAAHNLLLYLDKSRA
jgi:hypothetical protein